MEDLYSAKDLILQAEAYAKLRNWNLSYFRMWKLVEFIYWLKTGIMVDETRSHRNEAEIKIKELIDYLHSH